MWHITVLKQSTVKALDSSDAKHVMFNLLCRDFLDKKRLLLSGGQCNNQDIDFLELRVKLLLCQLKVSVQASVLMYVFYVLCLT